MRSERNHRRRFFALSHRIISELFVHAVRYEIQPMRMYLVQFFFVHETAYQVLWNTIQQ